MNGFLLLGVLVRALDAFQGKALSGGEGSFRWRAREICPMKAGRG